jgi:FixJ family two-component response regulator
MKNLELFIAYEGLRESLSVREVPRSDPKEVSSMDVQTLKISIVEDDESMRKAIKTLIEMFGIRVEGFSSAEEFLSANNNRDSACLILDVRIPGINGFELQSILNRVNHPVPIIFITGDYNEKDRARAIEAGAIEYLKKPFSEEALLNAISSALVIKSRSASDSLDQDQ